MESRPTAVVGGKTRVEITMKGNGCAKDPAMDACWGCKGRRSAGCGEATSDGGRHRVISLADGSAKSNLTKHESGRVRELSNMREAAATAAKKILAATGSRQECGTHGGRDSRLAVEIDPERGKCVDYQSRGAKLLKTKNVNSCDKGWVVDAGN